MPLVYNLPLVANQPFGITDRNQPTFITLATLKNCLEVPYHPLGVDLPFDVEQILGTDITIWADIP